MIYHKYGILCIGLFVILNILTIHVLFNTKNTVPAKVYTNSIQQGKAPDDKLSILNHTTCKPYRKNKEMNEEPILTLFTTIKDLQYRETFHKNTIKNWAELRPWVQPVLFVHNLSQELRNSSSWGYQARTYGWKVLQYTNAKNGAPVLKDMFMRIHEMSDQTAFVGFSNADILYDWNLIGTLTAIINNNKDVTNMVTVITGRRRNVDQLTITTINDIHCPLSISKLSPQFPPYIEKSADYFIFSKAGFYWNKVPDFVVGHIGYDTWILAMANNWKTHFIDATETISSIHQTGQDGITAGEDINSDPLINRRLFPQGVSFGPGKHKCAPLYSTYKENCYRHALDNDCIVIVPRKSLPLKCKPKENM